MNGYGGTTKRGEKMKKFMIFWWFLCGIDGRAHGHDSIDAEDEYDARLKAEDFMEKGAQKTSEEMSNFSKRIMVANCPENWGIRKIKEITKGYAVNKGK